MIMESNENTAPAGETGNPAPDDGPSAASPQSGPQSGDAPDWRAGIPQELREALGDTDPAEAAKIFARGKDSNPAQSPEDIVIKLADGDSFHPGLEKIFKDFCVAQKMSSAQAQAIVDLSGQFHAEANRIYLEQGSAALERRFGADTDKVRDNALKALAALDRKMDGRLSASPGGKQIASDPLGVEALYLIHQMVSEDSLGGGTAAGSEDKAMSDKDFLQQVLNNQQTASTAL